MTLNAAVPKRSGKEVYPSSPVHQARRALSPINAVAYFYNDVPFQKLPKMHTNQSLMWPSVLLGPERRHRLDSPLHHCPHSIPQNSILALDL